MRLIRFVLKQINNEEPAPLIITASVNEENIIKPAIPYAGWWGIPKNNNWCRAVVFKPDGIVDFGGDPEEDYSERYAEMQIYGKPIILGEKYFMKDLEDGEVSEFIVIEAIDLDTIK